MVGGGEKGFAFFLCKRGLVGSGSRVIFQDLDGFSRLGVERVDIFEQVEQLRVVHLEEHTSNLTGLLCVRLLDEREKTFAEHLLLLGVGGRGEGRGGERLLALGQECRLWGGHRCRHLLRHWLHWHVWPVRLTALLATAAGLSAGGASALVVVVRL